MAHLSPLNNRHDDAGATFLEFGSPDSQLPAARVVETFGEIEAEYAAIRKGVALLDFPHRAVVRVTGSDRIEFLNRMLTQELRPGGTPLPPGAVVSSFWLNRKGRIDADLRVMELGDDASAPSGMYLETDVLAAPNLVKTLEAFVFSEDIAFEDMSESTHRLGLHGPAAARLLADHSTAIRSDLPAIGDIRDGQATSIEIAGKRAVVIGRSNIVGTPAAALLQGRNATVTVVHSRTPDAPALIREADIVVAACGIAEYVQGAWLKPGAVVIHVGINAVDDASKKRRYRLVGDVDFASCAAAASHLTPVPGGVGPMTIAMLLRNCVDGAARAGA